MTRRETMLDRQRKGSMTDQLRRAVWLAELKAEREWVSRGSLKRI